MEDLSVLSTLRLMPETKREIQVFAENLINSVAWGDVNPLEMDGRLKAIEEMIDIVRKSPELNESLIREAMKYSSKTFISGNFKHQLKEVGVKYDFSECNDSELEDLNRQIFELSEKKKSRENFLKSIVPGSEVFGGDGVQLNPAVKTSTTKVVTLLL